MAVGPCPDEAGRCVEEGVFEGFRTQISASIAHLILEYAAEDASLGEVFLATSGQQKAPTPSSYPKVLARLFLVVDCAKTKELRLVNSKWDAFIVPILYRKIHLTRATQAACLLNTLSSVPQRQQLVKTIITTIPPLANVNDHEAHPIRRTLRKIFQRTVPSLQSAYFYTFSFIDVMIYLKDSLRGKVSLNRLLVISHGPCIAMSTSYIWSILREFPKLEEFTFEFRGRDGVKRETIREIPRDLKLPFMRRLRVSGAVIADGDVELLYRICPKLEEMEIDGANRFCIN